MLGTVCHITNTSQPEKNIYPIGRTTRAIMARQTNDKARIDKLLAQVKKNLVALDKQLAFISALPSELHCFRISSDLLPLFDCPEYGYLYQLGGIDNLVKAQLSRIGQKYKNIRLGMHPDQFCVLNSKSADVVNASLRSLEYHAFVGQLLRLDANDFNINVHINKRSTSEPAIDDLSDYAKACLSLENGDSKGVDADAEKTLDTAQRFGVRALFDVHHHLTVSGEIAPVDSDIVQAYIDTWGDVRPLMHVSQGRTQRTDCQHSDAIDSCELVEWVRSAVALADIEVEAKHKSVAVQNLFKKVVDHSRVI